MITDAIGLSTREITPEGYLKAVATITSVGVFDFWGSEKFLEDQPNIDPTACYKIFRPKSVVFSDETIESAKLMPITDGHHGHIDSGNNKYLSVGNLGENYTNIDGKSIAFNIIITDKNAVSEISNNRQEVSSGYVCKIKKESGTYDEQPYDFTFVGPMKINHLALVDVGRCGQSARILDSKKNGVTMKKKTLVNDDLDMDAVISSLSEKLLPDLKAKIQGDDFSNKLAEIMADKMLKNQDATASPDAVTPAVVANEVDDEVVAVKKDGDGTDVPAVDTNKPTAKIADASIADASAGILKRVSIIQKCKKINSDIIHDGKSNKVILQDALKPSMKDAVNDKSEDYLLAMLDNAISLREKSSEYLESISIDDTGVHNRVVPDALQLRKLKRKEVN